METLEYKECIVLSQPSEKMRLARGLGDPLVYAREEINPSTTEGSANVDVS